MAFEQDVTKNRINYKDKQAQEEQQLRILNQKRLEATWTRNRAFIGERIRIIEDRSRRNQKPLWAPEDEKKLRDKYYPPGVKIGETPEPGSHYDCFNKV